MISIRRGRQFFSRDLWRYRTDKLSRTRALGVRCLRVLVLSFRGFQRDDCNLRASALTFFSLLSIVPVLALGFGMAKGFGLEEKLNGWLREALHGHEEIYDRVHTFAMTLLENTQGGLIAGIGVVLLFWAVVKLLNNVEVSFNHIWGIKKGRAFVRRLADYTLVMFLGPILFVVAGSFNVFASREVERFLNSNDIAHQWFDGVLRGGLRLLPFFAIWALFTIFYIYMPNTRVRLGAGLLAGIVAGTTYQALQWVYIAFQVGVASYNAIYGSFAALPLFLAWVQLSWIVVLFGAEIAFAWQNHETYELEPDCLEASPRLRSLLALRATQIILKAFVEERPKPTGAEIAGGLEMPVRLVNEVLFDLAGAGIISEVRNGGTDDVAYQPARDPSRLTATYVLDALSRRGTNSFPVPESPETDRLSACLDELARAAERSPANVALKDL